MLRAISAAIVLVLAACDPVPAPEEASAPTDTDPAAILSALRLSANARGQVLNECGDWVTPTIVSAELGT